MFAHTLLQPGQVLGNSKAINVYTRGLVLYQGPYIKHVHPFEKRFQHRIEC
jgi:hypothetical protein